ncbi:TPA: hypothetical protein ACTXXA_000407 [Legionella anisa]
MKRLYKVAKGFLIPERKSSNALNADSNHVETNLDIYGKMPFRNEVKFSVLQTKRSIQLEPKRHSYDDSTKYILTQVLVTNESSDSDSEDDLFFQVASSKEMEFILESFKDVHVALDNLEAEINKVNPNLFELDKYLHVNGVLHKTFSTYCKQIQHNFECNKRWINLTNTYRNIHFTFLKGMHDSIDSYEIYDPQVNLINRFRSKILPMMQVCRNLGQVMSYDAKSCQQLLLLLDMIAESIGVVEKRSNIVPDMIVLNTISMADDERMKDEFCLVFLDILHNLLETCVSVHIKEGTIKEDSIMLNGQKRNMDVLSHVINGFFELITTLLQNKMAQSSFKEIKDLLSTENNIFELVLYVENYVFSNQELQKNYVLLELLYDCIKTFQQRTLARLHDYNSDPYFAQTVLNVLWSKYETISTNNFFYDVGHMPTKLAGDAILHSSAGSLRKLRISAQQKDIRLSVAIYSFDPEGVKKWIAAEKSDNEEFYKKIDSARVMSKGRLAYIDDVLRKLNDHRADLDHIINDLIKTKVFSKEEVYILTSKSVKELLPALITQLNVKQQEAVKIDRFLWIPLLNRGSFIEISIDDDRIIKVPTKEIRELAYLAGGEFGLVYSAKYQGNDPDICTLFPSRIFVFKELRVKTQKKIYEFEQERNIYITLSNLSRENPGLNCPSSAKAAIVDQQVRTEVILCEYIGQQKRNSDNKSELKSIDGTEISTILCNKSRTEQLLILFSISVGIINAELLIIHVGRILHLDTALRNILLQKNEDGSYTARPTDFGLSKFLGDIRENGRRFTTEPESAGIFPLISVAMQRLFGHGGLVEESAGVYELRVLLLTFVTYLLKINTGVYLCEDSSPLGTMSSQGGNMATKLAEYYLNTYQGRSDFDVIDKENISRYFNNIMSILKVWNLGEQIGLPHIQGILCDFYTKLKPFITSEFVSVEQEFKQFQIMAQDILETSIRMIFSQYESEGKNIDEFMACSSHILNMLLILSRSSMINLEYKWELVLEKLCVLQKLYQDLSLETTSLESDLQSFGLEIESFKEYFFSNILRTHLPIPILASGQKRLNGDDQQISPKSSVTKSNIADHHLLKSVMDDKEEQSHALSYTQQYR